MSHIRPGDYVLGYVPHLARWIAVLEVVASPYQAETATAGDDQFPCRIRVTPLVQLTQQSGLPLAALPDRLTIFAGTPGHRVVGNYLRRSPTLLTANDGAVIAQAIRNARTQASASANAAPGLPAGPTFARVPSLWSASIYDAANSRAGGTNPGPLSLGVPDPGRLDQVNADVSASQTASAGAADLGVEVTVRRADVRAETAASQAIPASVPEHDLRERTEIQVLLTKLGAAMGFSVWIAPTSHGRVWSACSTGEQAFLLRTFLGQGGAAIDRVLTGIDVLWLSNNTIIAAFAVESPPAVGAGVLQLADLLAMQPNVEIPLYIIAPDSHRRWVCETANRPTFARLAPPFAQACRLITFSTLRETLPLVGRLARHLRPEFLADISESCAVPPQT